MSSALAQTQATQRVEPEPIETDMHEFMEYVFQPTYKRLKSAMKTSPKDDKGWLQLKSGALILAEGGNLILLRGPQDNRDAWNKHAATVRSLGGEMYRAAHSKDFAATTSRYKAMLRACNSCHQQFAHGEHQLSP